jgi:hypothetical protein
MFMRSLLDPAAAFAVERPPSSWSNPLFTASLPLLALLASSSAWAVETTGQIRGTVVDADGLPVPGANVKVESPNYLGGSEAVTNEDGNFRFLALPPGEYAVTILKSGFLGYRASGVLVSSGGVAEFTGVLKLAKGGEEITVEEVKPAVDTQKVQTGAVLTRETLRDIPNQGRSYQSASALAPGVTGGANPNVRGAFDDGNQFYVDGVNNTDPMTGTFSQNMNFDAIEEVQVITGGMDAEYGRSLGGAINIVTRSGGNEFHGDAQLLYANKALQAYKLLPDEPAPSDYFSESLALNLGGPIIKDKLWFFTSLQGDNKKDSVSIALERPEDPAPRIWQSLYWFGKLTWQPSPQHRLWIQAQGDPTHIENTEEYYGATYTLPSGETIQDQGGYIISAGHIFTPSAKTILQTQAYWQESDIEYYPIQCKGKAGFDAITDCINGFGDQRWLAWDPDGFNAGVFPYGYLSKRYRASLQSNLTQYFTLLGEHAVKVGINAEYLVNDDAYPGLDNIVYKSYGDGDPQDTDAYSNFALDSESGYQTSHLTGLLATAYLQDVWNPVPRLTLRPGVRLDYSVIQDDVGELAFSTLTAAPRFGAAFDLTNDGRTNAHLYYGRFFDTGYLEISDLLHKRGYGYSLTYWDAEANDWAEEPAQQSAGTNVFDTDNLRNPYSDEVDLGIGRDVGGGWGIDGTFTYERSTRFWNTDEVNLIWNADGTDVIGYRDGVNESVNRIRTPTDLYTDYTSIEVSVSKQFNENFGVVGSYTWSRAYGTNDSQYFSTTGDIPEQTAFQTGLLGYDRTHQFKLAGSVREPGALRISDTVKLGLLAGWNFQAMSGQPYAPRYYNAYYGTWSNLRGSVDGTYRLPMFSQLDLKAGVTLVAGPTTWDLTLECFNVFDDRTVTSVETAYGNETGDGPYLGDDGYPIFGTPLTRQDPRYFQLGLRGEF